MKKGILTRAAVLVLVAVMAVSLLPAETVHAETYADYSAYESLGDLYADYFKLGSACEAISHWNDKRKEIGNPDKEQLIASQFKSITCGNELKPAYNFDPKAEGLFTIDRAGEEMIKWAKANGIGMRGHVLVWHSQVNPGFFAKDFTATSNGRATKSENAELDEECLVDAETLAARLKTYIYSLMEYMYANGYADVIYAWDVVNEATDENFEDGLRRSTWYRILGPDFLYYAFLYAREAELTFSKQYADVYGLDPEGDLSAIQPKLFYNDYNEWFPKRCTNIIRFLTQDVYNENRSMVDSFAIAENGDGTIFGDGLIDGIGMQGHLSDTQKISEYITALKRYSEAVNEVHITELDVGYTRFNGSDEYYQAKFYYDFFTALKQAVDEGAKLTSVTLWGLTDDSSWRQDSYPLLFNGDLSKKLAFDAMVMAAKGEEFTLTVDSTAKKLEELKIDFEPYKQGDSTVTVSPSDVGFKSRGTGHQAKFMLAAKVNHTEDVKIGYSLNVYRNEQDASAKLNIAGFAGSDITVKMYVKTEDDTLTVGFEKDEPLPLTTVKSAGDEWVEVVAGYSVPDELPAYIYIETSGASDIYIDDIEITKGLPEGWTADAESSEVTEDKSEPAPTQAVEDTKTTDEIKTEAVATAAPTPSEAPKEKKSGLSNAERAVMLTVVLAAVMVFWLKSRNKKRENK